MALTCLEALAGGTILGIIFRACHLPVPAPSAFAGVVGIFGVYLGGYVIPQYFGLG